MIVVDKTGPGGLFGLTVGRALLTGEFEAADRGIVFAESVGFLGVSGDVPVVVAQCFTGGCRIGSAIKGSDNFPGARGVLAGFEIVEEGCPAAKLRLSSDIADFLNGFQPFGAFGGCCCCQGV